MQPTVTHRPGGTAAGMAPKDRRAVTGLLLADFPDVLATLDVRHHEVDDVVAIKAGASVKLSWKCPLGPDHEWEATVKARCALNTGCPA